MKSEEWWQETAVGFCIHKKGLPPLADVGETADRDAQEVGSDGQGRAVEVATRQDRLIIDLGHTVTPEDQGIIVGAIELDGEDALYIGRGLASRAMHLRHTAQ
jgi:hypothetical protein